MAAADAEKMNLMNYKS